MEQHEPSNPLENTFVLESYDTKKKNENNEKNKPKAKFNIVLM